MDCFRLCSEEFEVKSWSDCWWTSWATSSRSGRASWWRGTEKEFGRLENCLESLEDATYQVWKWKRVEICINIFVVF